MACVKQGRWSLILVLVALSGFGCQTAPSDDLHGNIVLRDGSLENTVIVGHSLPIGSIIAYGGDISDPVESALARSGWLLCAGQEVGREEYRELYRVIGHIHGVGNGRSTFQLPDYRGMFLRGVSAGSGVDPDALNRSAASSGGRRGDQVGSIQSDAVGLHKHTDTGVAEQGSANVVLGSVNPQPGMQETHGVNVVGAQRKETRPKNAYVYYLIFAGVPQPATEE